MASDKISQVFNLRWSRKDKYEACYYQIEKSAYNKICVFFDAYEESQLPVHEYNGKYYMKSKRCEQEAKAVSGHVSFKSWSMNKKTGISCTITDIKVNRKLDRSDDPIPEFIYEVEEL